MEESRDPAIRLFGKMIPLRPGGEAPVNSGEEGGGEGKEDLVIIEATPDSKDHVHDSTNPQDKSEPATSSNPGEAQNPSADQDASLKTSKPEEQHNSTSKSQDETPKKPDKLLPCPRCRSLDTKFCYFNNYNVNQPRHFCKNCQRYWTAGGTMRNVPVGAGRRKNKSTTSHYRSITVSDNITVSDAILQTVRHDAPEPINHPPPKPDGTVLSFSSDAPLRETMASVLEAAEKTMQNRSRNGFHQTEQQMPHHPVVESYDEHSSGPSISTSSSTSDRNGANSQQPPTPNHQGFAPQIPYFNGSPWPCHWTPAPFSASTFPIAFYPPAAYWGCAVPGAWSIPWISPRPSFPNCDSAGVAPNSPTLGKHSREADVLNTIDQSKQERSLWIPKTTRIDTSVEAATSSIWATMGFENDKVGTSSGRGIFRAFHEKDIVKNHMEGASPVLHANPAALSRSLTFRENS